MMIFNFCGTNCAKLSYYLFLQYFFPIFSPLPMCLTYMSSAQFNIIMYAREEEKSFSIKAFEQTFFQTFPFLFQEKVR